MKVSIEDKFVTCLKIRERRAFSFQELHPSSVGCAREWCALSEGPLLPTHGGLASACSARLLRIGRQYAPVRAACGRERRFRGVGRRWGEKARRL